MGTIDLIGSLGGGALIGLSVTLMLLLHGRVTGITGIMVGATFDRVSGDWLWRVLFLAGLVVGGVVMVQFVPEVFPESGQRSLVPLAFAGLLVGFGTRLGNGCTSGHGVCGLSRFSRRSLVATGSFMAAGIGAVLVVRQLLGGFGT